jgi:Flp pilus assembly protein TadD
MRQIGIILLVIIGVAGAIGGMALGRQGNWIGSLLTPRATVPSPFAACKKVTAQEAQVVAESIVSGFNRLDAKPFNAAMDWDLVFGQAAHNIPLSTQERSGFIAGAKENAVKDTGPGNATVQNLKEPNRLHLLRVIEIDGHQHAQIRVLIGDGFNYLDLLIARTPGGQVRLVDFTDMIAGQSYSAQLTEVCLPLLAQVTSTPLERLVKGQEDLTVIGTEVPAMRTLMQNGKAAEAYKKYLQLPATFRDTKPGLMLRLQITQVMEGEPYQETLAEIDRRYPNDPTMGLALLDWHLLAGRTGKSLHIIERIDQKVGGDPYLDNIRASAHFLAKDYEAAETTSARACAALPDMPDVWWTRVSINLKRQDHARTAQLLTTMRKQFGLSYGDMTTLPDYADFVKSDEYRQWMATKP